MSEDQSGHKKKETGCCPIFDPEPWDRRETTWRDKLFVKDRVTSFLHIPLNFGKVMARNVRAIEEAGARDPEFMVLSDENSLWGADVYIAVGDEVPNARMERISGTFLTMVFEGPYKNAGKWAKEMKAHVASQDREPKQMYHWYTTCPRCAKVYGKNPTVFLARV